MSIPGGRRKKAAGDPRKNMFNVRRPVVLGFLTLFLLWGGLFEWGAFASISGAVIAVGRVEVETRDQVVEHIDGGTVREILVREGDKVKAGDVLLRFDDKLLRSEESILAATACRTGGAAQPSGGGIPRRRRHCMRCGACPARRGETRSQDDSGGPETAVRGPAGFQSGGGSAASQADHAGAQAGCEPRGPGRGGQAPERFRHPGVEGRAATLQGRSDGTASAPGDGARSGRTRRPDRRYRGEESPRRAAGLRRSRCRFSRSARNGPRRRRPGRARRRRWRMKCGKNSSRCAGAWAGWKSGLRCRARSSGCGSSRWAR